MAPISKAEVALWSVLDAEDPRRRTEAAFALASLLANRGEFASAEELLRAFTERGEDALRAEAWIRLAEVLAAQDKRLYRELAFRRAAHYASVAETPGILIDLAGHLAEDGDLPQALRIYQAVADGAGEEPFRVTAGFRIAALLRGLGRPAPAARLLGALLPRAGADQVPEVALALAEVLIELAPGEPLGAGEVGEAEHALGLAIGADHPDLSPRAALMLAELRRRQGRLEEAYRLCRLVIDSEHPAYQAAAHELQSRLLHSELERAAPASPPHPPACPAADLARRPAAAPGGLRIRDLLAAPGPLASPLRVPERLPIRGWSRVEWHRADAVLCGSHRCAPRHVDVELRDALVPTVPGRSPLVRILAVLKRWLGTLAAPHLAAFLSAPLAIAADPVAVPDLAAGGRWFEGLARECLLGELLAEAISSELLDLGAIRALVAELPGAPPTDPALLRHRGLLPAHTRTISELLLERHLAEPGRPERPAGPEPGEGGISSPTPPPRVVFLDYVERLGRRDGRVEIASCAEHPGHQLEFALLTAGRLRAGLDEAAEACDPEGDYFGLYS